MRYNLLTDRDEVRFDVLLITEEAKKAVLDLLVKKSFTRGVNQRDLELLPFDKIKLSWRPNMVVFSKNYNLESHWITKNKLSKIIAIVIQSKNENSCKHLETILKINTNQEELFDLEFSAPELKKSRQKISITEKMFESCEIVKELKRLRNAQQNIRFLALKDIKRFSSEIILTIFRNNVFDGSTTSNDHIKVREIFEENLKQDPVTSETFDNQEWNSVYWQPSWSRPDKLTRAINEKIKDQAKYTFNSSDHNPNKTINEIVWSVIAADHGVDKLYDFGHELKNTSEFLNENETFTKLENGRIVMKPITLYKINLADIIQLAAEATHAIQFTEMESKLSVPLSLISDIRSLNPFLTPENAETIFKKELDEKRQLILKYKNLTVIQNEVPNNLTKITETLMKSLKETLKSNTAIENQSLKNDSKTFDSFLEPIKEKIQKYRDSPSWFQGSYCMWAPTNTSDCPDGFARFEGGFQIKNAVASDFVDYYHLKIRREGEFIAVDIATCCR